MDLNYLSPYVRLAMDSKVNGHWKLDRVIFDYEIIYIKEGTLDVTVEGKSFKAKKGDIVFLRPKQSHILDNNGEYLRQPHVHFDLNYEKNSPIIKICFKPYDELSDYEKTLFRKDIPKNSKLNLPSLIQLNNTIYFEDLLFDMINEFNSKMPLYEIKLKAKLTEMLTYLVLKVNENYNSRIVKYSKMLEIKDYIAHNYNKNIKLDELEDVFNISKHHLIRLFKKAFYMTPMHYHQMIRIEKAKELIQYSGKSLTTIAEELGYSNIMTFSRAFKDFDGVPPSYYRTKK